MYSSARPTGRRALPALSEAARSAHSREINRTTDVLIGKADWPPGIARPVGGRA